MGDGDDERPRPTHRHRDNKRALTSGGMHIMLESDCVKFVMFSVSEQGKEG